MYYLPNPIFFRLLEHVEKSQENSLALDKVYNSMNTCMAKILFIGYFYWPGRKSLLPHNLTTKPNINKFKELFNSDSYNIYCKIVLSVVN